MIIALWILTGLGLALWSLLAWGSYHLLTINPARLDDINALADRFPYAAWIEHWLPGWRELLALAVDVSKTLLGWVGDVAPWLVWGVWGIGAFGMLAVAGLLALAIKAATPLPIRPTNAVAG